MSVIRNFVILFISLFLGISTAAAAGWTTPPKLALIPDNYKESNEGYDILEEFKTLDYVQMLKDVDNYGKQVDACTDIKCCDKIAQKIAEQFLPDNTEKFMNNIRNIIKNTDEASTLVTGFSRYFGDKGLDSLV